MIYLFRMTIHEIRRMLRERSWSQKKLAEHLCIHPVTLGLILTGKNKLTAQLAAHIELIFNHSHTHTVLHEIALPSGCTQRWVPGFCALSPEYQAKLLFTLLLDVARWFLSESALAYSPEQLAELNALCRELQQRSQQQ